MLRVGHQENANEATYTAHPEDTRHPKSDTDSEPGRWGAPRAVPARGVDAEQPLGDTV